MRWHNYIDPCNGVVNQASCNSPSSWTEGQQRTYNNWNLSSTPWKACEKMIRKTIIENPDMATKCPIEGAAGPKLFHLGSWAVASPPYTADSYVCTCDRNGDNVTNQADLPYDLYQIDNLVLQPRPICSLVPNGPYGNIPGRWPVGSKGGKFSDSLRDAILDKNYADHANQTFTDFWNIQGQFDPFPGIYRTRQTYMPYNDDRDPDLEPLEATWTETVQIDHIIPRMDIQGCPCGTNSKANALVISGGLNGQMSNLTQHQARRAILQQWTNWTPGVPLFGDAFDDEVTRTGEEATTVGGCDAGRSEQGGGGAPSGLVCHPSASPLSRYSTGDPSHGACCEGARRATSVGSRG